MRDRDVDAPVKEFPTAAPSKEYLRQGDLQISRLRGDDRDREVLLVGEYGVELLAGLDEGCALAQPFQFLGAGIGAGAAHAAEQVLDRVFDLAAIGHVNFTTLGRAVFLDNWQFLTQF